MVRIQIGNTPVSVRGDSASAAPTLPRRIKLGALWKLRAANACSSVRIGGNGSYSDRKHARQRQGRFRQCRAHLAPAYKVGGVVEAAGRQRLLQRQDRRQWFVFRSETRPSASGAIPPVPRPPCPGV